MHGIMGRSCNKICLWGISSFDEDFFVETIIKNNGKAVGIPGEVEIFKAKESLACLSIVCRFYLKIMRSRKTQTHLENTL